MDFQTILVALIGGGVVTEIDRKNDERYANTMRVRIMAFADEMADGKSHTEDEYESFVKHCEENKIEFKNNIATITIEYLKDEYAERLKKHDFRKVTYEPKRASKN